MSEPNPTAWEDTPVDQECASTGQCLSPSPTFYSTKRLAKIETEVLGTGGYRDIDDGRLGYLRPALPVDQYFVDACERNGDPESRLRFANECQQGECENWSGRDYSLVGRLISAGADSPAEASDSRLPRCAIRAYCRWFTQEGSRACRVCPIVVYREAERDRLFDIAAGCGGTDVKFTPAP
ncbi:hypothetical protein ACIRS3_36460 [Streptomyces virginiae]|uniref:hypothetical protein n=1 Tax=Streptomyces virginiae TaxID=1961 RepID=UPI00380A9F01